MPQENLLLKKLKDYDRQSSTYKGCGSTPDSTLVTPVRAREDCLGATALLERFGTSDPQ